MKNRTNRERINWKHVGTFTAAFLLIPSLVTAIVVEKIDEPLFWTSIITCIWCLYRLGFFKYNEE